MSKFLYAMHGECPKDVLQKGWVVFTHELGHDPTVTSGHDYSDWDGYGVIARLNNGYHPNGTIPESEHYEDFAQRCANWVQASTDCHHWIIGNEPGNSIERPHGQVITAADFSRCVSLCLDAITALPGHEGDIVMPGAIGPWNVETGYWIDYFKEVLAGIQGLKGICLHCYTHGSVADLVFSEQKMNAPYENDHYHFRVYQDFMQAIPDKLKHVPVFITEINQNDVWLNENNGWVQSAYKEINDWNQGNQQIHCLALYRWQYDKYAIKDKGEVITAFLQAQEENYQIGGSDVKKVEDGFENGFYKYNGEGELECPVQWKPAWDFNEEDGVLNRPEYKPAGSAQVRNGDGAATIHSRYSTVDGVLLRKFDVDVNSIVKASVWMLKVALEGGHAMQVGVHPHGGENFLDDSVVWSDWYSQTEPDYKNNEWRQRTVQTQAKSDIVTVFLRSKVDYKVDGSNAHFDDFVFEYEDGEPPDPPTPGEGLQFYIDALRADTAQMDADIDAMESYILSNAIKALPVG